MEIIGIMVKPALQLGCNTSESAVVYLPKVKEGNDMAFINIHARVFSSGCPKDEIIKLTGKEINTLKELSEFCNCFSAELFAHLAKNLELNERLQEREIDTKNVQQVLLKRSLDTAS